MPSRAAPPPPPMAAMVRELEHRAATAGPADVGAVLEAVRRFTEALTAAQASAEPPTQPYAAAPPGGQAAAA
eukprot:8919426-Lingulodinium_polyedra.AAC.1